MAESGMPILAIKRLTVELPEEADRQYAIEDVSLEVGRGEIVCVVGESGSGKSVTAHTVMGLMPRGLKCSAGHIRLGTEDILRVTTKRLRELRGTRMAMVFQEPMAALNPVMTIGDQIDEVLQIHTGLSRRQRHQRMLDIVNAVHLPEPDRVVRSYPHQLSGGQRQRVVIAAALVLDPELLIADEPTTALDVTTQSQILTLIREIQQRRGTGVLFITHDFGVVADIADRVVVMKQGRVVESGAKDEVLRRPQQDYTRMLISSVPSLRPPARTPGVGDEVLAVSDMSKVYTTKGFFGKTNRQVHAVDRVSLTIRRGETLGVVGESGSGKSTLARCIIRLIDPSSGSIRVDGVELAGLPEARLRACRKSIQMVFQDPFRSLNPRRKIGDSIVEGPMNFGLSEAAARARARDLIGLVGLSPRALERYPHQFSGGQRQRIAIARALAMEPKLLIADEAVSALDVSVQAQVLDLLDNVRRQFDLAMLFITHDLRVAAQICDRIAVMKDGRIVEQGATAEVFAAPRHEYTRKLFEAAPGHAFDFQAAARLAVGVEPAG